MEALLRGLNAAQRAAVTSPASVLQVLAPPGSGKTKTLTSRVAYLLEHHGYAPWNIICCTFTIKASREMRERLRGLVGEREARLQLGTFHSICRRYLVRYGHLIGIPRNFGIADASDSLTIIKRAVKRLELTIEPKVARSRISLKKSKGFRLEDIVMTAPKTVEAQEFHTIFTEYESELARSNLLDYDDLLIRCSDLLRAHPECVSNIEALLIDEFQDTNVIQFELMKLLANARRRITIVGDPDQSIYGFRSAEIENLRRMRLAYPDTVVINLEENYRSSAAILKLAQDVIEQDTERPNKKLKATHCYGTLPVFRKLPNAYEEAAWIATEIKRTIAMTGGLVQYSDIAILLRSAFLSLKIEKELTRNAIQYRMVGGHKFFDRVEIRTLLGYLRTISQPDNDAALVAIINVPSRKIGDVTVKDWLQISKQKRLSLWLVLQQILSGELQVDRKTSKLVEQRLRELINFIKSMRRKMLSIQQPFMVPLELLTLVIEHVKFRDYLKTKYQEDHEDRWENVQELLDQATDFAAGQAANRGAAEDLPVIEGIAQREVPQGEEMLAQYLANIVLSTEVETSEDDLVKSRVTISTIHSAKGLEWPVVFIPAAYEGSIPHSRAEDTCEERRLLYVAMTRAQALLNVTFPMLHPDRSEYIVSQFLSPKVANRFAQTAPNFCDRTIEGIASTLHRESPSQTALVDARLDLNGLQSSSDDLWPADGSARPMRLQDTAAVMYELQHNSNAREFQFGRTSIDDLENVSEERQLLAGSSGAQRQHPQGTGNFTTARSYMSTFRTTMSEAHNFSMPSTVPDLGNNALPDPSWGVDQALGWPSNIGISSQKGTKSKPKGNAVKSGQGSLTTFFVQSFPKRAAATTSSSLTVANIPRIGSTAIPQELSSHVLSAKPLPVKRPRAALEETSSPNRKRYVFLSSSPARELDPADQRRHSRGSAHADEVLISAAPVQDENSIPKIRADLGMAGRQSSELKMQGNSTYRPVTTMHTTSMGALSSKATVVKKTLGVRRTMKGWDDRTNK